LPMFYSALIISYYWPEVNAFAVFFVDILLFLEFSVHLLRIVG
jgi:hypothetical protein